MKLRTNLWPYAIILTFVLFISGTVSLVVMACSQKVDLVSPNYYEEELQFQRRLDSLNRTSQLGPEAKASVSYDANRKCILVSLPVTNSGESVTGSIKLYRPSAAGLDQQVDLHVDAHGAQVVDAAALSPGLWKVRISWTRNQQTYFAEQKIVIGPKSS